MKDIRPSTWVTLIILALLIFIPAFFVDVDSLQQPANGGAGDNSIKPVNPLGKPEPEPTNRPESPPANQGQPRDNGAVE